MDLWMELQRFYEEWKQCKQHESDPHEFGFTSSDGKRHIYMYQTTEFSDDGSLEWYIEINDVVDGANEAIDVTFSPVGDEACLMVQIAWCIEKFWNKESESATEKRKNRYE